MRRLFILGLCAALALASETASPGIAPPTFVIQWGKSGAGPGEFHSPIGIAIDSADVIFTTEFKNNRVQKFDVEGKFLGQFHVCDKPGGIAVDKRGRVYVASLLLGRIFVYDESGLPLGEWGHVLDNPSRNGMLPRGGGAADQFKEPGGIAIAPDGSIYVADEDNHRIKRLTPEGKLIAQFGKWGSTPGEFGGKGKQGNRTSGPNFLAFDARGDLYVTEGAEGRVQKLTAEGKPRLAWGDNTTAVGSFGGHKNLPGPIAVAVDHRGRIWVSSTNDRVQIFSAEGRYLTGFLKSGDAPGEFEHPHGIAVDSRGDIYVVDASNQRIQKFRW